LGEARYQIQSRSLRATRRRIDERGRPRCRHEIRYLGRVRERATKKGFVYVWSGAVQYVAGFTYTFPVICWELGFSLAGAALLWWTVPAARKKHRGKLWCFGASLVRLLPVIEINKEYTEFFNDPERDRLDWWQSIVFAALGIVGWLLGAVLAANCEAYDRLHRNAYAGRRGRQASRQG
jgi:hypothetical protein